MTFLAVVLVCTVINSKPDEQQRCVQLTDTRGPYPELEACQVRVNEMAKDTLVLDAAGLFLRESTNYGGKMAVRIGCVETPGASA